MKHLTAILIFSLLTLTGYSQKYMTRNGFIGFYSHTPIEDIKAVNNQVASVLDITSGDLVFQVIIRSFHFEKALMEEHFNENYMESEKYPNAIFKGKITNISAVNFSKIGTYEATVEGDLTIHNVTNKISTKGTIEIVTGGINATSKFNIVPEDYKITIPWIIRDKINKTLEVTVTMKYTPVVASR